MSVWAVWQRLTRLRMPPRSQPPTACAVAPAAATDPIGKQRRGYRDKAIHAGDYEDKERVERIRRYLAGDRSGAIALERFAEKHGLKDCRS